MSSSPLRLTVDTAALAANWQWFSDVAGVRAGAAVKADGYGLGSVEVARRLADAGCRDFFVATWAEAEALAPLGLPLSVLHGVRAEDMPVAMSGIARPVLNTAAQVARWKEATSSRHLPRTHAPFAHSTSAFVEQRAPSFVASGQAQT